MSKQYLTTHTIDNAHPAEIFALAATSAGLVSASGASALHLHGTSDEAYTHKQSIREAHRLGCHHLAVSSDGTRLASVGFGGEVKLWSVTKDGLTAENLTIAQDKAGEIWAIALSADGQYLATSSYDGHVNVWDTLGSGEKTRAYETKGSFGLSVDISSDGRFIASGHENGGIYVFDNETGRLKHSLPSLACAVRSVRFSPGCRLVAAAGDSKVIALYEVSTGEHVANLTGHNAWIMSIDWSHTGEYLLSGAFDGKTKVWSIDQRACVATHTETDRNIWAVKWLPKAPQKAEAFAIAGANRSISFYREATGG